MHYYGYGDLLIDLLMSSWAVGIKSARMSEERNDVTDRAIDATRLSLSFAFTPPLLTLIHEFPASWRHYCDFSDHHRVNRSSRPGGSRHASATTAQLSSHSRASAGYLNVTRRDWKQRQRTKSIELAEISPRQATSWWQQMATWTTRRRRLWKLSLVMQQRCDVERWLIWLAACSALGDRLRIAICTPKDATLVCEWCFVTDSFSPPLLPAPFSSRFLLSPSAFTCIHLQRGHYRNCQTVCYKRSRRWSISHGQNETKPRLCI